MKVIDKIRIFERDYFHEWLDVRQQVDKEFSDKQTMFCVCGRLATGMHERYCKRFNSKVNTETCKRLTRILAEKGITL